jgi:2-polyprenyl-3-methyl-5-hydroxy-6-metoxy-1,4-benzoquinol methylase
MSGFDWHRYWAEHEENQVAAKFALGMAEKLDSFIRWDRVSSFADYGCGPATMLLALAQRHPETCFHGFDVSEPVLSRNRLKAEEAKLSNTTFRPASLPSIEMAESYDVVTCLSTLHYVEHIEEAVRNLFGVVEEGGCLLFNYPNLYTHWMYKRDAEKGGDEMRRRFALVLSGRNLITQRTIQVLTGVRPRRFHAVIRGNIYVSLQKKPAPK